MNLGDTLDDLGLGKEVSDISSLKENTDKMDFIKIKNICPSKYPTDKMKRSAAEMKY